MRKDAMFAEAKSIWQVIATIQRRNTDHYDNSTKKGTDENEHSKTTGEESYGGKEKDSNHSNNKERKITTKTKRKGRYILLSV